MISLCIISREEDEEPLAHAIIEPYNYVDEIVIIDTGTEPIDRMVPPFTRDKVKIIPFKWTGSFADARNFSFEQAKGDVIFWIDSDDTVLHQENLPKLAKRITDGEVDWVYSEYIYQRDETGNIIAKHWKPRLFRKGTGKWIGDVHEDFIPSEVVVQKRDIDLGRDTIQIEHHATPEELLEHSKRNLEIQLKEIERDGDNVDPRTIQYTAMSYQGLSDFKKAIPYFLRHSQITGSKEDKFWSLYRAGLCFYFLKNLDKALNLALESLKLFPHWKSSYYLIATIYYEQEDWAKVIEWTLTGLEKADPDTLQVISDLDYTILPLGKLAMAYLQTGNYHLANETAIEVYNMDKNYPGLKDLVKMCMTAVQTEGFVKSFLEVVQNVKKYDRVKAVKLFDLVPKELDEDHRIQAARSIIVPPKVWEKKSIVIYCGRSLEEWAYPSVFTGIGGSEKAVINMSKELAKQGYSVTVYNRCGHMKGVYDSVEYLPYYYFNKKDHFDTLIIWRNPLAFADNFNAARKYLWLHDIAHPEHFNEKIYANIDKIFFLSKWHRTNLPDCPEEKVFITNNGINPGDFKELPKKRPNSLIWSSSYDRGLVPFMKNIWPLIRKEIPNVTIDIAYGTQNIEKEMGLIPSLKEVYNECQKIFKMDGVTHHGRISHKKLAELMGSSMVYPYASEFGETNNMTSQECQWAGCFVITCTGAGGTAERVKFGKVIDCKDIYTNKKKQKEFAQAVIYHLKHQLSDNFIAATQMDIAGYVWSSTANQWIKELSL